MSGADAYILKPINPDALRMSLAQHAELRREQERTYPAKRLATIGEMIAGKAHESCNALQRSQAYLEVLTMEVEDRPEAQAGALAI